MQLWSKIYTTGINLFSRLGYLFSRFSRFLTRILIDFLHYRYNLIQFTALAALVLFGKLFWMTSLVTGIT